MGRDPLTKIRQTLGLEPDATPDEVLAAVHGAQANVNYLRAVVEVMADMSDAEQRQRQADSARSLCPHQILRQLEEEFDALRDNAMTPTQESIIQAVHDAAGKAHEGGVIRVEVPDIEYAALCDEERDKEGVSGEG